MIKLILGGFPCTQFSLAQKKNRINKVDFTAYEFVEFHNNNRLWYKHIDDFEKYIGNKLGVDNYKFAEGLQLFFNCIAAIDRTIEQYPNDKVYYMFENVSSMQKSIKETLTEVLHTLYGGVSTEINSALVSAQTRKRIYFTNYGQIPQPEDKEILLKDILESGVADKKKAYCLKHQGGNTRDYFKKHHTQVVFEPISINPLESGKARTITAGYANQGVKHIIDSNFSPNPNKQKWDCVAIMVPDEFKNLICDKGRIYEVRNGKISTKFGEFEIDLSDGFYFIRKLSIIESKRLQTIPEWYEFPVSDTQAYKMLGNGWTKDVISHILSFIPNIQNEEIDVLSLYDGMSCGKLALMDLGCEENINTYRAYEIDPYAIKTTQHNFPDTIQCGDAFKVRDDDWEV